MNEQKVGSYNPLRHKHGALWDTWKWRIPNRFFPEQKTKKSFVLRYLRPVHEVLTIYLKLFDRSASARVEELLILENFECTDDAFNEGIIFRWFPQ